MPTSPILTARGLTIRFGGLTAIHHLDIDIERGSITSIIGPNGAGKTTLFNTVSGLVAPTAGDVRIAGHDVRRTWSWRPAAAAVAVGLVTAIAAACLAIDLNGLWRATVRRPMSYSNEPFTYAAAGNAVRDYLRGRLALERQSAGRWAVVTADGSTSLAVAENRQTAEDLRRAYEAVLAAGPEEAVVEEAVVEEAVVEEKGGDWRLASGKLHFPSRDAALAKRDLLVDVGRRRRAKVRLAVFAAIAGGVVGGLGTVTVWSRSRWTPERVTTAGVARTFQNLRIFRRMTVLENVLVAIEAARPQPFGRKYMARAGGAPAPQTAAGETPALQGGKRLVGSVQQARRLLEFVSLTPLAERRAGELAYGDQRRLEIARALAVRPRLLLLDEPAAGMNATETVRLMELIRQIRASGVTVVLIEHEMDLVMGMSDQVIVLDAGKKIAEGPPQVVRRHPAVIEAYLGASYI
ncbi:MAG TPA: ATP-binding cassette domain-containing protein [Pirellulales bacterium]|nr:ATP-binding cassette domain-containing protein [Pirellulales bacterium]